MANPTLLGALLGNIGQSQQMPMKMPQFTDEHFGPTDENGIKPFNDKAQTLLQQQGASSGQPQSSNSFMGIPYGAGGLGNTGTGQLLGTLASLF